MEQIIPADVLEKRMALDRCGVILARTQSSLGIAREQLQYNQRTSAVSGKQTGAKMSHRLKNGYRVSGHMNWVKRFVFQNRVENFILIFTSEG